jgi:hypothetical protein
VCMAIFVSAHSFGVPGWSTRPITLSTCLRGMTKKTHRFLHFMDIFLSYCPQFWDSRVIYKAHDTQHIFRGVTKNSLFLHFRAVFMRYCPQFWGSRVIYKVHDT